jgi:hypothetical protein
MEAEYSPKRAVLLSWRLMIALPLYVQVPHPTPSSKLGSERRFSAAKMLLARRLRKRKTKIENL